MSSKRGSVLMSLGLLLLGAALVLTAYNLYDADRAARAAAEASEKLEQLIPTQPSAEETEPSGEPEPTQSEPDFKDYPQREMPAMEVDGYRYIGILEIPAVGLKLPIMEECDETRLKIAPCRYSGSVYLDNMVISGHNYSKHFSPIRRLGVGAEVVFTDVEGTVFRYVVVETETLQPDQIHQMVTGDWDLTLFTCNLGGQTRYAVRCERVKE